MIEWMSHSNQIEVHYGVKSETSSVLQAACAKNSEVTGGHMKV